MAKDTKGTGQRGTRAEPGRSSRKARQAAEAQRQQRRRRVAIAAIVVIPVLVAAMVIVSLNRGEPTATPSGGGDAEPAAGLAANVPVSALNAVGTGSGVTPPQALPSTTPPLEVGGVPEVLYVGAEYCPFCAAQRWPVVVALGRFGAFTGLGATASSATDVFPSTQTFSFYGSTYASDEIVFTGVETETNQPAPGGGYTSLQALTPEQEQLLATYDAAPYTNAPGSIPFLMIGDRYLALGASFDPSVLQGKSRDEIARALSDPSSPIAQAVNGSANAITAAVCGLTHDRPADVCTNPTIASIAAQLPGTS